MTRYDIDVIKASAVVSTAAKSATKYEKRGTALSNVLAGGATTFAHSELVAGAVMGFVQEVADPDLTTISGYTNSALLGTSAAIAAYHEGDEAMVAQAQKNAAKSEYPASAPGAKKGPR